MKRLALIGFIGLTGCAYVGGVDDGRLVSGEHFGVSVGMPVAQADKVLVGLGWESVGTSPCLESKLPADVCPAADRFTIYTQHRFLTSDNLWLVEENGQVFAMDWWINHKQCCL
jgi:hypothetical protein